MTIGAIRCLRDYGMRVPEDVAFVGYDDNAESKFTVPSLSSINVKKTESAVAAVDMLINRIFSKPCEKKIILEASLEKRESSEIK